MEIVVDSRAFVVGLTELFRREMRTYEVTTLLPLAEAACKVLALSPAMVPIEGYYSESDELERFFRLVRALQLAEMRVVSPGPGKDAISQLREVFISPAMGRVEESTRVLPRTSSPFGEALRLLADWSIDGLSRQAQHLVGHDDAGLVAVASATGDPITICVARESVALMADVELAEAELPDYIWAVSKHVAEVAQRFVSALADSTGITLPKPEPSSSLVYGQAAREAQLVGRCILIGERSENPRAFYHWYIDVNRGELTVKDFWSSSIWTTESLRSTPANRRPASGAHVGAPDLGTEPVGRGNTSHAPVTDAEEQHGENGWFARLFQRRR